MDFLCQNCKASSSANTSTENERLKEDVHRLWSTIEIEIDEESDKGIFSIRTATSEDDKVELSEDKKQRIIHKFAQCLRLVKDNDSSDNTSIANDVKIAGDEDVHQCLCQVLKQIDESEKKSCEDVPGTAVPSTTAGFSKPAVDSLCPKCKASSSASASAKDDSKTVCGKDIHHCLCQILKKFYGYKRKRCEDVPGTAVPSTSTAVSSTSTSVSSTSTSVSSTSTAVSSTSTAVSSTSTGEMKEIGKNLYHCYPMMWRGTLLFKNHVVYSQFHFVSGNRSLVKKVLGTVGEESLLQIKKRMRLQPDQLELVQRKIGIVDDHCVLMAVASGTDRKDFLNQQIKLKHEILHYLTTNSAAGIIKYAGHDEQPPYVLHLFPSCEFTTSNFVNMAPTLFRLVQKAPYMMVIVIPEENQIPQENQSLHEKLCRIQ